MTETTDISALEGALIAEIGAAADLAAIERVRIAALGRKGRVPELMAALGSLPADQRKARRRRPVPDAVRLRNTDQRYSSGMPHSTRLEK